jgi:hypothetical protein
LATLRKSASYRLRKASPPKIASSAAFLASFSSEATKWSLCLSKGPRRTAADLAAHPHPKVLVKVLLPVAVSPLHSSRAVLRRQGLLRLREVLLLPVRTRCARNTRLRLLRLTAGLRPQQHTLSRSKPALLPLALGRSHPAASCQGLHLQEHLLHRAHRPLLRHLALRSSSSSSSSSISTSMTSSSEHVRVIRRAECNCSREQHLY